MNERDVLQVKGKFFAALVLIIATCFYAALSVIYFGNGMSINVA